MCVSGFPEVCRLDRCPKMNALGPPVAFICDICGELEDMDGYKTPEKKNICSTCIDIMTVQDALVLLGCLVIW